MRGEFSFPDIKKLVMDHLAASLEDAGFAGVSVPIYSNRPDDGAQVGQSWVRVVATGGQGRFGRVLQDFQVTVDSYAGSTGAASDLARQVDEAMYEMVGAASPICRVRGFTPGEFPDPDIQQARWTCTYQLTVKLSQKG